ncbi:MAG: M14 family zinc carboxypeptidase [Caldilineaceae bacterium]
MDLAGGAVTALGLRRNWPTCAAQGFTAAVDAELNRRVADGAVRVAGDQTSGIPWLRLLPHRRGDLRRFALAAAHPDLATWTDIGDSWAKEQGEGGYDIFALRLTNRAIPGPAQFVLMAAIHAREYTTAELATRFAERLIAGYWTDPDITWLLDYHELHVIPQINPDGRKRAEAGVLWRKNVNSEATAFCPASSYGIDLNRNSSFQWNQCDGFGCSSGYVRPRTAGRPPPEPETNVIQDYLAAQFLHPPARPLTRSLADTDGPLHQPAQLLRTGALPLGLDRAGVAQLHRAPDLGAQVRLFYRLRSLPGGLIRLSLPDRRHHRRLVLRHAGGGVLHLRTGHLVLRVVPENSILEQSMDALMYAFKAVRRPYLTPAGPEVVHLSVDDTNRRRRHARATERRGRRHPL